MERDGTTVHYEPLALTDSGEKLLRHRTLGYCEDDEARCRRIIDVPLVDGCFFRVAIQVKLDSLHA